MAKDDANDDEEDDAFLELAREFMREFKEPIKKWLEEAAKSGGRRTREMAMIMVFLAGIVAGTGILTYTRTLSGEAFAFLVGTILMYLFDIVRPRLRVGV